MTVPAQDKKIVFIDPPGWQGARCGFSPGVNNGIAYLAAAFKKHGWAVQVIDLNNTDLEEQAVLQRLQELRPSIVGFSCKTATFQAAVQLATLVRQQMPGLSIIYGGPHITLNGQALLSELDADLLFEGDGETDMPLLAEWLINGRKESEKPHVQYGELIVGEHGILYHRLSLQPIPEDIFPDYTDFPEIVKEHLVKHYPLISSRGCPYRCIYCTVPLVSGGHWRGRSVPSIMKELKNAIAQYHIQGFEVLDDSWNVDMNRSKEMCQAIIDEKLPLACSFPNGIRADRLDEELVGLMKHSGCELAAVGFESTIPEVFNGINKGTTIDKITHGIRLLKAGGIVPSAFFIVGLPGDTLAYEKQNIRNIRKLKMAACFNLLIPYPHTKVIEYIQQHGKILKSPEEGLHFCNHIADMWPTFEYPGFTALEMRHAFIAAVIGTRQYAWLSPLCQTKWGYYKTAVPLILKNAPEYLPEFLWIKFCILFKAGIQRIFRGIFKKKKI